MMLRAVVRTRPSSSVIQAIRRNTATSPASRRCASTTSPVAKTPSWKSSSVRWILAAGLLYWYNTSETFAEELQPHQVSPPPHFSDEDLPTVEAVVEQKRREAETRLARAGKSATDAETSSPSGAPRRAPDQDDDSSSSVTSPDVAGPDATEDEAGQQGAFNPETGEINWDCPCLGGMAHGPCGEEFKAAFSCFVYSEDEPKGINCIDKFQHMQDCFRKHPEVYGDELADDEDDNGSSQPETATQEPEPAPAGDTNPRLALDATPGAKFEARTPTDATPEARGPTDATPEVKSVAKDPTSDAAPEAKFDARDPTSDATSEATSKARNSTSDVTPEAKFQAGGATSDVVTKSPKTKPLPEGPTL